MVETEMQLSSPLSSVVLILENPKPLNRNLGKKKNKVEKRPYKNRDDLDYLVPHNQWVHGLVVVVFLRAAHHSPM